MNKIALKKFVIINYLASCNKYPYGYGKYIEDVGDFRLTSLISHILGYNHPNDSTIRDDAKECGCIAGISLSNGQLTHANFSKSKLFDFTADVLYNEKKHLITILSENGNRDYIDYDTIIRIFIREGV